MDVLHSCKSDLAPSMVLVLNPATGLALSRLGCRRAWHGNRTFHAIGEQNYKEAAVMEAAAIKIAKAFLRRTGMSGDIKGGLETWFRRVLVTFARFKSNPADGIRGPT